MMETNAKLYALSLSDYKTYVFAALFVTGNIALPQLCHLIPQGGLMLLPIYFFTLVGAYKFGTNVGLLTAILSPLVNSALFGMPAVAVLPSILLKSAILAIAAGYIAKRSQKVSLLAITAVVLLYQVIGTIGEFAINGGNFNLAIQDFRIGMPGILLQIFGGYAVIKYLIRK